jgi:hypothetical protein
MVCSFDYFGRVCSLVYYCRMCSFHLFSIFLLLGPQYAHVFEKSTAPLVPMHFVEKQVGTGYGSMSMAIAHSVE